MGRLPCCDDGKSGLKKGPWTPEEDMILLDYVQAYGHGSWRSLPKRAGLLRCGKSCRLRWTNYLRPDIKRGPFTPQEQQSIIQLHAIVGNKWSTIAAQLPGRTDNEIKNFWNSHLKKRLRSQATSASAAARHTAQWESARLEAEARLSWGSVVLPEPDFFLRIWNSEVGNAFRKKNVGHGVAWDSPSVTAKAETESKSCVTAGAAGVDDSSASNDLADNVSVDESYQLYLDLSVGGEQEMGVFGGQMMGLPSVFCGDPAVEASLDTAFISGEQIVSELTERLN